MGGIDSLRGIYIQVLGSLLLFLNENKNIDFISVEPFNESEKVDLLIQTKTGWKLVVQVKSSKNIINAPDAHKWAKDLENTSKANEYILMLFGQQSEKLYFIPKIGKVDIYPPMNLNVDALMEQACFRLLNYINKHSLAENFLKPSELKFIIERLISKIFDLSVKNLPFHEKEIRNIVKSSIQIRQKQIKSLEFSNIFIKNEFWQIHYDYKSFFCKGKVLLFEGYGDFGKSNNLELDIILYNGLERNTVFTEFGILLSKMAWEEYPKGVATPKYREVKESKYHFKIKTSNMKKTLPKDWLNKKFKGKQPSNLPYLNLKSGPEIKFSYVIKDSIIFPSKDYIRFKITVINYLLNIENNSLVRLFARFGKGITYSDYIHINSLI
ncbi:hypothetical protein [Leptospira santarosai]|uniref:hypothetical protein n=1 Tax=Leptospira santarosai TaxID=28183 RepID=UPI0007745326|nr:hypothetical protein [Leptospira santarosai]MDI7230304.1 hypothetical protein [Leptospira santarosai]